VTGNSWEKSLNQKEPHPIYLAAFWNAKSVYRYFTLLFCNKFIMSHSFDENNYNLICSLAQKVERVNTFDLNGNFLIFNKFFTIPFCKSEKIFQGQKVGIFQGTFDPPTKVHLQFAEETLKYVDILMIYPTNRNSKKYPVSLHHRVAMIRFGLATNFSDRIVVLKCTRQPSFPDFIRGCQTWFKGEYFICQGIDKFFDLPWFLDRNHPGYFIRKIPHIVKNSKELKYYDVVNNMIDNQVVWLECNVIHNSDIRSSDVRTLLGFQYYYRAKEHLRNSVYDYIIQEDLYHE